MASKSKRTLNFGSIVKWMFLGGGKGHFLYIRARGTLSTINYMYLHPEGDRDPSGPQSKDALIVITCVLVCSKL